ncbi:MAG: Gfo/Idh/MocA family oxidoreductase [Coriobacteriia bacterium]|nr:Gfo/Idh/MocA family oxidoreductase [Coriobacteriia bacterium]
MTVNVALVGFGYWGPNLLRNYWALPDVYVSWLCDLNEGRLAEAKTRYPALETTTSLDDVLGDPEVDAVVIATPITTHHAIARAALLAGKHVFVEKPMTASAAEADDLVALGESSGKVLMVGHTFVFSPPVQKVKEIIASGELGDVYFITSSRVNLGLHQRDVSVIWDLAPHDLSILEYWLGETPSSVGTVGRGCVVSSIPDVAFMSLGYESGMVAQVEVSWLSPVKLRRTVIVGSKKMLVYDDTENVEKVKVFDHGVDFREPESFGEYQLSYRTGDITSPKLASTEPLFIEASHFVECIRTGARPMTDARAGRAVVRTLEAAERAMRGGCRESV